jgi:hypothetical protein
MPTQEQYEQVLRDALEDVFVAAIRQGIDTGQLAAELDADRGPGPDQEHTLTISIRETALAVMADGIPHEWISTRTGFIDIRFSRRIAATLSDLERKAQQAGRFI